MDDHGHSAGFKFSVALFLVEAVRLIMDVLDWMDTRRTNKQQLSDQGEAIQTVQVYQLECSVCKEMTGVYTAATGTLMPPIICTSCINPEEEEEDGNQEEPDYSI